MIPYGKQWIDDDDVAAVISVLRCDWLTTGPSVGRFEAAVADFVGCQHAVALSSGTAALHAMMHAIGIGPGDEVIVPAMTFAASANCVVYCGGTPVFADVDPATLLVDPDSVESLINDRTIAVVAVDYAGQPCDYHRLQKICDKHAVVLLADACHSLGASYQGRRAGGLATMSAFSFHPVKPITTAEGGMVTTNDAELAERIRCFRNHGITTDVRQRQEAGVWFYEMKELGFNYRLSDLQCALGLQQLQKLESWVYRRRAIAATYDESLANCPRLSRLSVAANVGHAYHLYVVAWPCGERDEVFRRLREQGIGVNVHYVPVHLHPFYRERFGTRAGMCPHAEAAYERILSLPIYPRMTDADTDDVIAAVREVATSYIADSTQNFSPLSKRIA
jgi:perosamine synthetase